MTSRAAAALLVAAALAAGAASASGQPGSPARVSWPSPSNVRVGGTDRDSARAAPNPASVVVADLTQAPQGGRPDSWWAPGASAILPGAGQFMLGQDRSIAYLAAEAYGWIRFVADLREARRQRGSYEQLAATVARAWFAEEKPTGDFAYYERMEHFVESGVFDASADDGVQPETDDGTFNGSLWLRARATFWDDPLTPPPPDSDQYLSAVRYYEERAIRPEFRWSWRDAQLEQDLFRRTIDRSNDAYRRSLQDLGVILANHVLSAVDAYVTLRVRRIGGASGRVGVAGSVPWSPDLGFGSHRRGGR